jgi:hypothetical protein
LCSHALTFALAGFFRASLPTLQLRFSLLELCSLLVRAMEGDCSPLLDNVGGAPKVAVEEVSATGSSSEGSMETRSNDDARIDA